MKRFIQSIGVGAGFCIGAILALVAAQFVFGAIAQITG